MEYYNIRISIIIASDCFILTLIMYNRLFTLKLKLIVTNSSVAEYRLAGTVPKLLQTGIVPVFITLYYLSTLDSGFSKLIYPPMLELYPLSIVSNTKIID